MSETYSYRHPLDGKTSGSATARSADHLEVVRRPAMASILAKDEEDAFVATRLAVSTDFSPRFAGPGEWLAVSLTETPDGFQLALQAQLDTVAHVIDQSDGRVLMRLSGPNVRRVLTKGIGADLHPSAFALGMSANVLCGHISVNLASTGQDEFELIVARSFAVALFEDLLLMGREFGLSAGFSA